MTSSVLVRLTPPQSSFYLSEAKYPLFVGGFGSGKSTTMTTRAVTDLINYPGANIACYAPTYDLLKLITEPFLSEQLFNAGLKYTFNKSDHIFTVAGYGKIICRSLSNPERIIGYEVFRSHIDELDTLKLDAAENAWNKVIARNRQKLYVLDNRGRKVLRNDWRELDKDVDIYQTHMNRVSAYTTPEGYLFAYKRWVKEGGDDYVVYKASTYSNPHLPEGYIDGLINTYPEQLIKAYLEGEFVNLTSGSVYKNYDRELNNCTHVVEGNEPLHVGIDFNVEHGAASIHVMRNGLPCAVDEIHASHDTDETVSILQQRYPNNRIHCYPDATGTKRSSSNSSVARTDIAKLTNAGFTVHVNYSNPRIRDRVNCVNAMILNGDGERLYLVNVEKCPNIVETLEQQVWNDNGEPDKKSGLDHMGDGLGYFITKKYPIVKNTAGFAKVVRRRG